jgi:hypothetical protein
MAVVSQIIEQVRVALGDNFQPFRYTNPELITYIRNAEVAILSMRPDALQTGPTITLGIPTPHLPAINSSLNVRLKFERAVVCFVCKEALKTDAEHAANLQLAQKWEQDYNLALA